MEKYINELKINIERQYDKLLLQEDIKKNCIIRGHVPTVSCMVENEITNFLSDLIKKDYIFYIDCTVNKKRPDLLVVNKETNKCELIIEIKSNMGYCRKINDASKFIKELEYFKKNDKIKVTYYEYTGGNKESKYQIISKNDDVKMIFLVLTSDNCNEENHIYNRIILNKNDIQYFTLFSGWYNDLKINEVNKLCEWLDANGFL